jgi:hypothetical protein
VSGYRPLVDGPDLDDMFGPAQPYEPLPPEDVAWVNRAVAGEWGERARLRGWLWGGRPPEQHR